MNIGTMLKDLAELVLISFREWLHSYVVPQEQINILLLGGSHLFQRVASFLHEVFAFVKCTAKEGSHLFQRVASFLLRVNSSKVLVGVVEFSSLSESGFIPTPSKETLDLFRTGLVLISFREWLHSY